MGRGVRMACEACDFWADLFEQTPAHARATLTTAGLTGAPARAEDAASHEAAAWSSYLCPRCVEPVDLPAGAPAVCPRCASPLLDFAAAAEELAAAARTRVAFDLRSEVAGREQAVRLLSELGTLRTQEQSSALSGPDVIATLIDTLHRRITEDAGTASIWLPLGSTAALAGLDTALAAAPSTAVCATLLSARLEEADRAIGTLEHQMDEEASLPGVPCPRCGTGHLLHWPIWV